MPQPEQGQEAEVIHMSSKDSPTENVQNEGDATLQWYENAKDPSPKDRVATQYFSLDGSGGELSTSSELNSEADGSGELQD